MLYKVAFKVYSLLITYYYMRRTVAFVTYEQLNKLAWI